MELHQLFMNLLINSLEAIPKEGQIHIRTWQEPEHVCICIQDSGVGIPAEHLEKIFDPGFTTKGVGVGTSMGLPICYKIVEKHSGKMQVESQPHRGTSWLPIRFREARLTTAIRNYNSGGRGNRKSPLGRGVGVGHYVGDCIYEMQCLASAKGL
ncbi:MAG: hypothetical protein DMG05_07485 [Acidobacteria bacterium]|nr:MAG: hypothetical protein DMG05_07485 [Acidobacteriota bacterium]